MKTTETKMIRDCYAKVQNAFNSIEWTAYADRLLDMIMEESKAHDMFRGDGISRDISIQTEARYFALKRLYECRYANYKPDPIDTCMMQRSCLYAYSMAKHKRFEDPWRTLEQNNNFIVILGKIASWDYCDLIRTKDRRFGFKSSPVER
jgi:hypothetical protein